MKRLALATLLILMSISASAKLSLRLPTGDGMVLQQQTEAAVWGNASPGATVTVQPSWGSKSYKAKADGNGHWTALVSTPAASYTKYTIRISGEGSTITVRDVLVGEVWLASGQSNMEMPIRGFVNCPVEGAAAVVAAPAMTDKIRFMTVPVHQTDERLDEVWGSRGWEGAESSTVGEMSATAFFFARQLNATLDIPIGIVSFARGGARVESWLPKELLESYGTEDLSHDGVYKRIEYQRPFQMYNAMEQPIKGYTARGFIWYQGCSNVGQDSDEFISRMSDLVDLWRSDWGDTEARMPFYMVEIAPYRYKPFKTESDAATVSYTHLTLPTSLRV